MKKVFIYILFIFPAMTFFACESNDGRIVTGISNLSATNKTLVELFTNTSCIPCVPANEYLNGILFLNGVTINDTNVIIIRYHTNLFPADPFYEYNIPDANARISFYNAASSNPRGYLKGTFMGLYNANNWTNLINQRLATISSFGIDADNTYEPATRSGNIDVVLGQISGNQINDLVIHVVLTEDDLYFMGQNGETLFENVMRDLITPSSGLAVTISPAQSVNLAFDYAIDPLININKAHFVIFLQSTSTKEVFGVERVKVLK
ncbi:MAG: Omp28-related outer membrane protein [Ignavibacteria bacterium]|nr:Omp28-related outer membrane protein [Ignavibacteria bacterium]